MKINFEPALEDRNSKWFEGKYPAGLWISSQLEDRNLKWFEAEYRADIKFRASSKIEIQNDLKPNIELT